MNRYLSFLLIPKNALLIVSGISFLSLISAFVAEYGFDLKPCILCIWQRWPHALVAILGLIFIFMRNRIDSGIVSLFLLYCVVMYATGTGIAAYHVGVEQHWWVGTPSCGVPAIDPNDINAIRELINSKTVRCDEPAWVLFGLSMAAYNTLLSFGLLNGIRSLRGI
jgi:disulfide bond formation protein DsbB